MDQKKLSHSSLQSSVTSVLAALLCILIGRIVGLDVYKIQGLELASRATEMPLKPMAGRLVEFSGFHWDTLDRKYRPAPKPASAPALYGRDTRCRKGACRK